MDLAKNLFQVHGDQPWHVQVMQRRNRNIAAVALANKNARTMWALLAKDQVFDPQHRAAQAAYESDETRDAQGLTEVMAQRSDRGRPNPITPKSSQARELDREPIRGFPSGPGASRATTGRIHDCILDRTTIIKTLALEGTTIHERWAFLIYSPGK